jgi:hypothetical protein
MALIKCVECGTEISDRSTSCVNCGAPQTAIPGSASAPGVHKTNAAPRICSHQKCDGSAREIDKFQNGEISFRGTRANIC